MCRVRRSANIRQQYSSSHSHTRIGSQQGWSSTRSAALPLYIMVDYSRFDHIGSDSDSGDDGAPAANVPKPSAAATALRPPASTGSTSIPPSTIGSASPQAAASSAGGGGSSSSTGGREKGGDVQGPGKSGYFPQPVMMTASNKGKEGRIKFEHEGVCVCYFRIYFACARALSPTDDLDAWRWRCGKLITFKPIIHLKPFGKGCRLRCSWQGVFPRACMKCRAVVL